MSETLRVLYQMAANLKAELIILQLFKGKEGDIAHIKVKKEFESFTLDLKVYLLGDEDSGKSTTLGVLVSGKPDNGKGSARNHVFRHPHEFDSGKTSCLSHRILGFDGKGKVTNNNQIGKRKLTWAQIVEASQKILTFIDVGGSKKFLRTLLQGLSSTLPDYGMLCIGADKVDTATTHDHFKLAKALDIPIFIILTKTDLVSEEQLASAVQKV